VDNRREEVHLYLGRLRLDVHSLIYSTIILMTALALYDEGTDKLIEGVWLTLLGISIAPLFALMMAHSFSDALDLQIRFGRRLSPRDRRAVLLKNVQYLYVAIPSTLLLGVFTTAHIDANVAVDITLLIGLASLFFWGSFAARKAKLGWLRQITFGLSYGLMGVLVLIVELALTH
jgi:hypothetical protein